jgi:hypothetical protein
MSRDNKISPVWLAAASAVAGLAVHSAISAATIDDIAFGTDAGNVYIRSGVDLNGVTSDTYGGGANTG